MANMVFAGISPSADLISPDASIGCVHVEAISPNRSTACEQFVSIAMITTWGLSNLVEFASTLAACVILVVLICLK